MVDRKALFGVKGGVGHGLLGHVFVRMLRRVVVLWIACVSGLPMGSLLIGLCSGLPEI